MLNKNIHKIVNLYHTNPLIILAVVYLLIKGNHEDLFLKFLNKTEDFKENYIKNGGLKTLESFGYSEI